MSTLLAEVVESVSLYSDMGTSDKEYHLYLMKYSDGKYSTHAEYGPRGNIKQVHSKGLFNSYSAARVEYDKVYREKMKEYREINVTRKPVRLPVNAVLGVSPGDFLVSLDTFLSPLYDPSSAVTEAGELTIANLARRIRVASSTDLTAAPGYKSWCVFLGSVAIALQDYAEEAADLVVNILSGNPAPAMDMVAVLPTDVHQALDKAREDVNNAGERAFVVKMLTQLSTYWKALS